jgi:hypothetical protein
MISSLLTDQWNARHDKSGNEGSEGQPLRSIDKGRPSVHIEIGDTIHVPWVQKPRGRIQKVVVNHHFIPCGNEIGVDIESDFEISVHAEEPCQGTVNRVMEGSAIKSRVWATAQEILIIVLGDICCLKETEWFLSRRATTTANGLPLVAIMRHP